MPRSPDSPRGFAILLTPVLFTAFLFLPLMGQFFDWHLYSGIAEKRTSALFPDLPTDLESLDAFPVAFDAYYSDEFGLRGEFITLHNLFFYATTHSLPGNRVIVGKGPWLFGKFDNALLSLQHRLPLFTPAELDVMAHRLKQRQDWLASQGRAYLFFVTPAKSTIYPDMVPDRLRVQAGSTRLEQAQTYFSRHPVIAFLDTTQALKESRALAIDRNADIEFYHYTDTHWNALGAYTAYKVVIDQLGIRYPDQSNMPKTISLELFAFHKKPGAPGDLSGMAGIKSLVSETELVSLNALLYYVSVEIPGDVERSFQITSRFDLLPDLLLFHDSFGEALRMSLSNAARESYFLWTHDFMTKRIEEYNPRIVLTQITERFFNAHDLANPVTIRLLEPDQMALDWKDRGDPALQEIRFDNGLVCQAAEIRLSDEDVEIRILWRADQDLILDGSFVTFLRKDGWAWYKQRGRQQCPEKSRVTAGSLWEDRLVFPRDEIERAEEFVLRVLDADARFMEGRQAPGDAPRVDFMVPRKRFVTTQQPTGR